jgi:hypothetical protein
MYSTTSRTICQLRLGVHGPESVTWTRAVGYDKDELTPGFCFEPLTSAIHKLRDTVHLCS